MSIYTICTNKCIYLFICIYIYIYNLKVMYNCVCIMNLYLSSKQWISLKNGFEPRWKFRGDGSVLHSQAMVVFIGE